ncbi:hypothetical protein FHS35_008766 [Streptomyces umbrinus]|nr:hypothetical protein [Streptomyces umbrinus]GHH66198.1 hypothetical protein GCM10018775_87890 [Streptomyces umbrinus]
MPACPYGVIEQRPSDGRAFKCTMCYDRLGAGQEPACAKACPTESIQRKPQRTTLHSWPFAQLGGFIAYKARRAGVPVIHIDPAYTSQECSQCHHIERGNRPDQARLRVQVLRLR